MVDIGIPFVKLFAHLHRILLVLHLAGIVDVDGVLQEGFGIRGIAIERPFEAMHRLLKVFLDIIGQSFQEFGNSESVFVFALGGIVMNLLGQLDGFADLTTEDIVLVEQHPRFVIVGP